MNQISHLNGIRSRFIETSRLRTKILETGSSDLFPVIFLHGNASASTIWEELMLELADEYYCITPDLRGYGQSDPEQLIDATRGMMEWVDDLRAMADELGLDQFHLVGHSLGGSVCWGSAAEMGSRIKSITLMAPGPPYGFGGIHGKEGIPNNPDFSGSGAGVVNQTFATYLKNGVRDSDNPIFSPRAVMNRLFWRDGFRPEREEEILTAMMQIHCGEKRYPGDFEESEFWPYVAPGKFGPVNALSPKYNISLAETFLSAGTKPPVLWMYGDQDQIIADKSLSDPGYQGKAGYRDGWPGEGTFPPQPMKQQIRFTLDRYKSKEGRAEEIMIRGAGHTPFLEQPDTVYRAFRRFLSEMVNA